ncbi:RHS repeat domain-containing protein [Pleionea mediterranea]|uniref:RHS repeat-associated protein n=1 Tax=Pleionea mediterranea TaxID=523701 RepID=A0A316FW62_9GAMM|nr:RHS repeat-associated core domain-containing protein [Pleionea mediterranea]PWK53034.1 RHS repeat-associated protein [Pleionea mediterranea]
MKLSKFFQLFFSVLAIAIHLNGFAEKKTITFIHTDHLGSPVMATDEAGNVKWREDYQPFGKQLTNQDVDNNIGYTGHKEDKSLGLTYMQARWYHPNAGRFMSTDPIRYRDIHSFNRYVYANNNPYNFIDPDGKAAIARNFSFKILTNPNTPRAAAKLGARAVTAGAISQVDTPALGPADAIAAVLLAASVADFGLDLVFTESNSESGWVYDPDTDTMVPPDVTSTPGGEPPNNNNDDNQKNKKDKDFNKKNFHKKNKSSSNKNKHQKGERRVKKDQGGEKGDARRHY